MGVLEGVGKAALKTKQKKSPEDQQESLNKQKSKGHWFKGKRKGIKAAKAGSLKEKVRFQGKKMKVNGDDEHDENDGAGPAKTKKKLHQNNRKHKTVQETSSLANKLLLSFEV